MVVQDACVNGEPDFALLQNVTVVPWTRCGSVG